MKNILLIGVGRFGRHIAMHLNQLGHQVMAVDRNEERIDAVMPSPALWSITSTVWTSTTAPRRWPILS